MSLGPYTTMRTIQNGTKIFEFNQHLKRLEKSARGLGLSFTGFSNLSTSCLTLIKLCLDSYLKASLSSQDFRITFLLETQVDGSDVSCFLRIYLSTLPLLQISSCQVELKNYGARKNAEFKNSQWIKERESLENSKKNSETNEILLVSHNIIHEGISSNFGAISVLGNKLLIGDLSKVLLGTMLQHIIKVAIEECHLKVDERPIQLETIINEKLPCFICSTSRGLLPIERMILPDGTTTVTLDSHKHPAIVKLKSHLEISFDVNSTPI